MPIPLRIILMVSAGALLMSSCSFFKGLRSGSKHYVDKAPYYHGKANIGHQPVGHLPVQLDIRLAESPWDSTRKALLEKLLQDMNDYLDSLNLTIALPPTNLPAKEAPDIFVGIAASDYDPSHYTEEELWQLEENPRMVLYQYSASKKWKQRIVETAARKPADYILYITLGFSDYRLIQTGWSGKKEVNLGTSYRMPVPWLSDLDTPVEVLHLTGALLNKEGSIERAGAEGIIAKRTGFIFSVFGLREGIPDYDLEKLFAETRREDLPGKPLAWKVALRNLTAQLLGSEDMLLR